MANLFVLFLVYFTAVIVSGTEKRSCDYAFGDPSWDYSKVYFEKDVMFPAGTSKQTLPLPTDKRVNMISYVCVNLPHNINIQTTTVNFDPLHADLSVVLAKVATEDFKFHVLALRHGY